MTSRQVFTSKAYWGMVMSDVLVDAFDAEISHHRGRCVEGGEDLSPHPTRAQLYVHNLPEEAAVAIVGWVWMKARGPKWVMPIFVVYPIQAHLRAGLAWKNNCW